MFQCRLATNASCAVRFRCTSGSGDLFATIFTVAAPCAGSLATPPIVERLGLVLLVVVLGAVDLVRHG